MDVYKQIWVLNTVAPISCFKEKKRVLLATGFFCHCAEKSYLITNKHVVIKKDKRYSPDEIILKLHNDKKDFTSNIDYPIALYDERRNRKWIEHPNRHRNIDVVAIPLNREDIGNYWTNAFQIEKDIIPLNHISIAEELFVIGYPLGFHDERNNLPVIKNATVASHPNVPFNGNPYFLIDAQLHGGSSGSPVLTKPNTLRIIEGKWVVSESLSPLLVGIFSSKFMGNNTIDLGFGLIWPAYLISEIINQ